MYKLLLVSLLSLMLGSISFISAEPAATNIEKAIDAANQKWMKAVEAKDAAAVASCYTKDAKLLPPNEGFVEGTQNIQNYWQEFIKGGLTIKLHTTEIHPATDTATEVGTWEILDSSGKQIDNGKFIVLWKNEANSWKLHRDMWSSNNPPAAAAK